jgi:hypothetical protein
MFHFQRQKHEHTFPHHPFTHPLIHPTVEGLLIQEVVGLLCNKRRKEEKRKIYKDGNEDMGNKEKGEVDAKKSEICSG